MAIVNSNQVTLLIASTEPAANAANATLRAIGEATSVSLDLSRENITITSKASNSYVERIPGVRDWTASGDGYLNYAQEIEGGADGTVAGTDNANELFALMEAGTQVYIRFGVGDSRYLGGGYITSVSQSGGTDEAPTYSFSLEGNGQITFDADVTA